MKKLVFIALLLPLFALNSYASHIVGGEITYKHVEDDKYEVQLVVYRDCSECLLDGAGGGSSTKNCNKPTLELRVSSEGSCTGDAIGLVPITRYQIRKILPVCESTITKCEDNSNWEFGVEAHYYRTTIDFSKYTKYKSCGFELYMRATDRSTEITNLSVGSNAKFYNYSYIYPWVDHNSPQLSENPQMLVSCLKSYTHNILSSTETDSISITSEVPMEGRNVYSKFNVGYSKAQPLRVECREKNCTPNRRSHPINGFYLDNEGNVAFTAKHCSENAIIVYQIEKWRKVNNSYVKLSTVRRDLQHIVVPNQNNTPAFADTSELFSTCIGNEFCKEFEAYDAQTFVGGNPQPPDTVKFTWTTNIPDANIKVVKMDRAPYNKLKVCWTPDETDYRDEPYYLRIVIKDNACPLNASASKVIKIQTRKNPEIAPLVKLLNCGHILTNSNLNKKAYTTEQWLMRDENDGLVASSSQGLDTLVTSKAGKLRFEYKATDEFGCSSSYTKEMVVLRDFVSPELIQPIIPIEVCDKDNFSVEAVPLDPRWSLRATWFLGSTQIGEGLKLNYEADEIMNTAPMTVRVSRIMDGVVCSSVYNVPIKVKTPPAISLWDNYETCYGDDPVDLTTMVSPLGGIWHSDENLIDIEQKLHTNKFPVTSKGGTFEIQYSLYDDHTTCTAVKDATVTIYPLPESQLEDVTICRLSGKYNLEDALLEVVQDYTYSWKSTDGKVTIVDDSYIELTSLAAGSYHFECTIEAETGCKTTGTFTVTLLNTAEISFTKIGSVCKPDNDIDLNELLNVTPRGGIWYDNDLNEVIADGKIAASFCGNVNVNYTYDSEGCYDSKNTSFEIICKPKIEITTPDKICKNVLEFVPTATPIGGVWSGAVVRQNKVQVPLDLDEFDLIYSYNHNGCVFDESKKISLTEAPTASIPNLPDAICEGESILVNSPISNVTNWSIDRNNLPWNGTQLVPTQDEIDNCLVKLSVRAMGDGLCNVFEQEYEIAIHASPEIDLTEKMNGCEPYSLDFTPKFLNAKVDASDVDVTWNFNDPYSNRNSSDKLNAKHTYDQAGDYDLGVSLTTDEGCTFETIAQGFVQVHEKPVASFSSTPDDVLSIHDPVMQFYDRSTCKDEMRYIWDFGTNNSAHKSFKKNPAFEFPKDTGSFTVKLTVISEHQCISEFTKDIYINPDIRLFVPTAFTPNQKGPIETEVFKVSGVNVKTYSITVWNRWGQIVFQSTDINEVWDGKYGGKYCQPGAFGYKVLVTSESEQDYIFTGVVNLLR